jgi:alpha-beta hydrolase superfamily lysophospholipase
MMLVPETITLPSGLFCRQWQPEGPARGSVIIVHGLGEHSGRYQLLAEIFAARGLTVIAMDHPGHGESPGHRVFVKSLDDFSTGVRECRAHLAAADADLPCFILGHSMGGLIVSRLMLEDQSQYRGALLSGPAFEAGEPPSPILLKLVGLLAKVLPRLGVLALDANGVSRDPKVVEAYNNDPLVNHGKVTAGLAYALLTTMGSVLERAGEITLPLLVMHGEADSMAAPSGSEHFVARVGSQDLSFTLLPQLYHEIFNEPEGPQIMAAFADWIDARLP